jgi:Cytochrome C biogenesis protein transmembrane region
VPTYQKSQTREVRESILPRMTASVAFGEALALGLASGPACLAACGQVLVPSLLTEREGLRSNARYLFSFLGARLVGYLLFAVVAWELGALVSLPVTSRVLLMGAVNVSLAGVLLWYAHSASHTCGQGCSSSRLVNIEVAKVRRVAGAAASGLLTGLSLCPPFVAAGVRAAELGSVAQAVLFFIAFFVGTSAWFVPFAGFSCIARNEGVITVARMAMVLISLYYLALGIAMLIGRKSYGY